MLPDSEADCLKRIGLQNWLRQAPGDKARQDVSAAALSQIRIPGAIHKHRAAAPANECLMSLEHDPGIAEPLGEPPQRSYPVRLDLL